MTPDGLILAGRSVYFDAIEYDKLGVRWQARISIDTGEAPLGTLRQITTGYSDPTIGGALARLTRICVADRVSFPWHWDDDDRGDHYMRPTPDRPTAYPPEFVMVENGKVAK